MSDAGNGAAAVAWRTPMVSNGLYQMTQRADIAELWRNAGAVVEPLYAIPEAAQARVKVLEEALAPFAEIAKEFVDTLADDKKNTMHWAVPTVGQLRAARAALTSIPE